MCRLSSLSRARWWRCVQKRDLLSACGEWTNPYLHSLVVCSPRVRRGLWIDDHWVYLSVCGFASQWRRLQALLIELLHGMALVVMRDSLGWRFSNGRQLVILVLLQRKTASDWSNFLANLTMREIWKLQRGFGLARRKVPPRSLARNRAVED